MGVTISVQTAVIVVSSIGALHTALAVLFGALTCFFVRETRKRKGKVKPEEDREKYPEGKTASGDDMRCDSAYGTAASGSAPSPSASMDTNASQGHLMTKSTKDFQELELRDLSKTIKSSSENTSTSGVPVDDLPKVVSPCRAAPKREEGEDTLVNQDAETVFRGRVTVNRTNSYLSSVVMEDSSEPYTVLTVHKSTLKRKPKPTRTNSQQPLMTGEDREATPDDEEEKTEKKPNPAAPRVTDLKSESAKKPRRSPLPWRKHGHQRPIPKRAARSNSTKPLMASQDDNDLEEPTQEDWEAIIQGVESPPNRKSLVLENQDTNAETQDSIEMLHLLEASAIQGVEPPNRKSLVLENQDTKTDTQDSIETLYLDQLLETTAIQGVEPPPNRKSLVLENQEAFTEESQDSLGTLHLDLLEMMSKF